MPERKLQYQTLENKLDIGFFVTAPSLERLYIDAGLSLSDQLVKLDLVEASQKQSVAVSGNTREELMVKWLSEILSLFERHQFVTKRIVFNYFDGEAIRATLWGELHQPIKHGHVSEIKAVPCQQLELGDSSTPEPHFYARVFLDLSTKKSPQK